MKYAVVARDDEKSISIKNNLIKKLSWTYDEANPDVVISLGGDGTILRAIHQYIDNVDKMIFFGVNTGKLGFYTDWQVKDIDILCDAIETKNYQIEKHSLIEYEYNDQSGFALNEMTIVNPMATQVVDVYIDDTLLEVCRGTGLCISTTNGSTAYNKSLGGPVVDSKLECFLLTEIASINSNAYRSLGSPLVLSNNHLLNLRCHTTSVLTVDQLHYHLDSDVVIKCWLSKRKVNFAKGTNTSFVDRIKKAFL